MMSEPQDLQHFVVVLNRTQDVVNIAGSVRALLNMGMARLRLVAPDEYDAYRIAGIAHGSEWLLEQIEFFDTLEAAVADAVHIVGTTARRRTSAYVWEHPRAYAPELVERVREYGGPVALVFGREDKGLSNEDLDLCDRLLLVPTSERHSSLNLAQAVLLVCYELRLAALDAAPALPRPKRRSQPAAPAEMQQYYEAAEEALAKIDFFKKREPEAIMRTVRALARRAEPTSREVNLLRAMAIEVRKVVTRLGG